MSATLTRPPGAGSVITGTAPLFRATVKHQGVRFAPWILLTTTLSAEAVVGYPIIFPTVEDRLGWAAVVKSNPAIGLIFGPAYDLTTVDGINAWRNLAMCGFLAALGVIFTLTRATRAQEDTGQAELLSSGVMGRSARLMSAVVTCLAGSLLLGVVTGLVTVLVGGGVEASMLLAATMTATGWMFTGVAAISAEVCSDARAANSLAAGTLGALYLLRGFAYAVDAPSWTVWANPLGWMTETKPANGNHWWPLLLAVALTVLLLFVAFRVQARRDFGVGAVPPRPGPARGTDRSTWRLALRINRGPMIVWVVVSVFVGLVLGYFTTSINDILADDSALGALLASGATSSDQLVGAFLVTVFSFLGILAAVPGVQTMLKVRAEEQADRVEPIIATAAGRSRYFAGNVAVALGAPAGYILIGGLLVAALASAADIGVSFGDTMLQAAATMPATWTVIALAVTVVGVRPQLTIIAWLGVLVSFGLTVVGPTLDLPDRTLAISPFWHVPAITLTDPDWTGLIWISAVTLLFLALGFAGFRRRDLAR